MPVLPLPHQQQEETQDSWVGGTAELATSTGRQGHIAHATVRANGQARRRSRTAEQAGVNSRVGPSASTRRRSSRSDLRRLSTYNRGRGARAPHQSLPLSGTEHSGNDHATTQYAWALEFPSTPHTGCGAGFAPRHDSIAGRKLSLQTSRGSHRKANWSKTLRKRGFCPPRRPTLRQEGGTNQGAPRRQPGATWHVPQHQRTLLIDCFWGPPCFSPCDSLGISSYIEEMSARGGGCRRRSRRSPIPSMSSSSLSSSSSSSSLGESSSGLSSQLALSHRCSSACRWCFSTSPSFSPCRAFSYASGWRGILPLGRSRPPSPGASMI